VRRLIHYSKQPLLNVYSVDVEEQISHRNGLHKPVGLWVSVEGEQDWKEWCESESWGLDGFIHATEIILTAKANVLRVESAAEIDRFHKNYSVIKHRYSEDLGVLTAIQWPLVAREFGGIVIAPYIWERRLHSPVSDWYYEWDCASGCIWDADAVADLRRLETA
jgi:hypothetical protein